MTFKEVWQDFVSHMEGIAFANHVTCLGFVDIVRLWNFHAFTEPDKYEDIMQLEGDVFVSVPNPKRIVSAKQRKKVEAVDGGDIVDDMRD